MSDLTEAQLAELERIAAAATPGPWRPEGEHQILASENRVVVASNPFNGHEYDDLIIEADDRDFMVAARTAIPVLVAEVRRLRSSAPGTRERRRTVSERGGLPIKEIPALVLDVAREMGWVDKREAESLRSALSAAREEARAAEQREAKLRERMAWDKPSECGLDTLIAYVRRRMAEVAAEGGIYDNGFWCVDEAEHAFEVDAESFAEFAGRLDAAEQRAREAEAEARRLTEAVERKDIALRAANAAMNHMGDVLNEMDAVEPEDEEKTSAAFALVRIEIGEAMPGDEERARAALGSSPVATAPSSREGGDEG